MYLTHQEVINFLNGQNRDKNGKENIIISHDLLLVIAQHYLSISYNALLFQNC